MIIQLELELTQHRILSNESRNHYQVQMSSLRHTSTSGVPYRIGMICIHESQIGMAPLIELQRILSTVILNSLHQADGHILDQTMGPNPITDVLI